MNQEWRNWQHSGRLERREQALGQKTECLREEDALGTLLGAQERTERTEQEDWGEWSMKAGWVGTKN